MFLAVMLTVLAGCTTPEQPVVSDEPSNVPVVNDIEEPTESSTPVTIEPITFTEEHKQSLIDYLKSCSYVSFTQTMDNGLDGQAVYSTTRYSLSVNTEQKVHSITMRYIEVNGISREGVGYKMITDGDKIMVSENGVWAEADGVYETVAWDLSQFENTWDVFSYLLRDVELPVGAEGTNSDGYWSFEFSEEASDTLLTGIEYDELLGADYKFTFRDKDGVVRPDSVTVRVGYKIAEVDYYVSSTIQLNGFGNTKIAMPEIGQQA